MISIKVTVKGQLNNQWSGWFDSLTVTHPDHNVTILTGFVMDQAALYGIISHLRDLGLTLISVSSKETEEDSNE
ncbi:MAG: hypothetical protein A2Y88_04675 [Chloroflexi bacterium RBG_13_48_10]|nr:MAG: hypothetical protein A2Y88_04675 [Chloroflexi bacterium RBG_13_48_10]